MEKRAATLPPKIQRVLGGGGGGIVFSENFSGSKIFCFIHKEKFVIL